MRGEVDKMRRGAEEMDGWRATAARRRLRHSMSGISKAKKRQCQSLAYIERAAVESIPVENSLNFQVPG
jgi:hypothetical protein